jgi:hypothetical protein
MEVLLSAGQMSEKQRLALNERMTVGVGPANAVQGAARKPATDAETKLKAVRGAVQSAFPTAVIHTMLDEIERGYRG